MATNWTKFINALAEVCEDYYEAKERADAMKAKAEEKKEIEEFGKDIFFGGLMYDRTSVTKAMVEQNWTAYDIRQVLNVINTSEKAKVAVELIKAGYGAWDVRSIVKTIG